MHIPKPARAPRALRLSTSLWLAATVVVPGCFCGTPDLAEFNAIAIFFDGGNGDADVFAGLRREGTCTGDASTLTATINGREAEVSGLRNIGGGAGGPTLIGSECVLDFSVSGLTFDDDGDTEDVTFSVASADASVEGTVPGTFPHVFVDLGLEGGGDVVARGSRHRFEVTPPLVGDNTVRSTIQRSEDFVQPTPGTQVSPDVIEVVVADDEATGSGRLVVEALSVRDCEIEGLTCEAEVNVRVERAVTVE